MSMSLIDKTTGVQRHHLSATQIEMFCRCPEQYRRRYIEGERIPPGIALIKGAAFHRAAETNMRQKVETHEDLPPSEIVDVAVAEFETAAAGEIALTPEEASRGTKVVLGEAKDDVADMAYIHAVKQAPDYQPIMVEQKVLIELPQIDHDLLGVVDLVDDKQRIVDFKTSSRRKSQLDADASIQLTIYAAAYQQLSGRPPEELRLDCIVKTDRQVLTTKRTLDDMEALANRIVVVSQAIKAGIFPPTNPTSWWCSPVWCGYWSDCPYRPRSIKKGE